MCNTETKAADVIVCGGGITGVSIAYHLAKRGKFVCLLERDCLGYGNATGINSGFVTAPMFWKDSAKQYFAKCSIDLYNNIAENSLFQINRCGRTYLASKKASEITLRRMFSRRIIYDEKAELIDDPSEMLARWPILQSEDIVLALFSPSDLFLDPIHLCKSLADRAREYGAQFYEHCNVQEILIGNNEEVIGVKTNQGIFETGCFVDATGIWCGTILNTPVQRFRLAAYPATSAYLSANPLPDDYGKLPIFIHVDEKIFLFADKQRTIIGGFNEESCKPLTPINDMACEWEIPWADWDAFYKPLKSLLGRFRSLGELPCGDLICGGESYTPDKNPVIGEIAEVRGYYVASGFNGQGLSLAGGVGEVITDLICNEAPRVDISEVEVTRFIDLLANPQYLMERVPEVAGRLFVNLEYHQYRTARNLRMSPVHRSLRMAGGVFSEILGYERALWFTGSTEDREGLFSGHLQLAGHSEWFDQVGREYEACRERVGLIDLTSFSKFDIKGPDCVDLLQKLCSWNIDQPIGTTMYTGMQNENGGYVTDCTISRLGPQHFFIIAPTVQQLRFILWVDKWAKNWQSRVNINDVTGLYTALDIVGPASRNLMQDLTKQSMTSSDFPTFANKVLNIGIAAGIRVISVSHCGELGYVLYIPNEVAQNVYERIIHDGRRFGLLHVGYYALKQLRIEKFYVHWGTDVNSLVTPFECGRSFRVDFTKDFIGKAALLKQKKNGVHKKYIQLLVYNHNLAVDPWPQGGEVIYRDGEPAGRTTSAAYGFTLGCQVCIGYIANDNICITDEFILKGNYKIDIAGKKFPVKINIRSPSLPMISSEHPSHYQPTQQ